MVLSLFLFGFWFFLTTLIVWERDLCQKFAKEDPVKAANAAKLGKQFTALSWSAWITTIVEKYPTSKPISGRDLML